MAPKRKRSPSVEFISWKRVAPFPFNEPGPDDFVIRTQQNTYFHVSSTILSLASPYFRDLISKLRLAEAPLTLEVPESQTSIETILRLTYPIPDPVIMDLDDVTDAYTAALKYKLGLATASLRRMFILPRFIEREPLRVYALSVRFELEEEVNLAAFHACKLSLEQWPDCEELDYISGSQYHALLVHHRRRGTEAVRLLQALSLASSCRCGRNWMDDYKNKAVDFMSKAPASDYVFSAEFIVDFARDLSCIRCSNAALQLTKLQGPFAQLKQDVMSIPFEPTHRELSLSVLQMIPYIERKPYSILIFKLYRHARPILGYLNGRKGAQLATVMLYILPTNTMSSRQIPGRRPPSRTFGRYRSWSSNED